MKLKVMTYNEAYIKPIHAVKDDDVMKLNLAYINGVNGDDVLKLY